MGVLTPYYQRAVLFGDPKRGPNFRAVHIYVSSLSVVVSWGFIGLYLGVVLLCSWGVIGFYRVVSRWCLCCSWGVIRFCLGCSLGGLTGFHRVMVTGSVVVYGEMLREYV